MSHHNVLGFFVIKGDTDSALAAWQMTSANPSPHRFLPSRQTACVSWLQPSRHASAAPKQKRTSLERSPQRDTLLEAPWNGTVTVSSPLSQTTYFPAWRSTVFTRPILCQRNDPNENCWQQHLWIFLSNWVIFLEIHTAVHFCQRSVFDALSTTNEIQVTSTVTRWQQESQEQKNLSK